MTNLFDWKRRWVKVGKRNTENDNNHSDLQKLFRPNILDEGKLLDNLIPQSGCLVLLGEAGIGKSTEIKRVYSDADDPKIFFPDDGVDLNDFFSHDAFKLWREDDKYDYRLYVFIDALDESSDFTQAGQIFTKYIRRLDNSQKSQLSFIIACRSNKWDDEIEKALIECWGSDKIQKYQLSGLNQQDIQDYAQSQGVNADTFWNMLDQKNIISFAQTPLLLPSLVRYFKDGSLPDNQVELYEKLCLDLCEETYKRIRDERLRGKFSSKERLEGAKKLAFLMTCRQNSLIWIGSNVSSPPSVFKFAEFDDSDDEYRDFLEEILNTGLFVADANSQLKRWGHQNYIEFLTACYLCDTFSVNQIQDILYNWNYSGLKTQFIEIAAWCARINPNIYQWILDKGEIHRILDTGIIFDSIAEHLKPKTIDAILSEIRSQAFEPSYNLPERQYLYLKHSEIASQLRGYIEDKDEDRLVRYAALDMVAVCNVAELEDTLIQVIRDDMEYFHIRSYALGELRKLGTTQFELLRPLLVDANDINLDLRWITIRILWDAKQITFSEVLSLVTYRPHGYVGMYSMFLHYLSLQDMSNEEIIDGVKWFLAKGIEFGDDIDAPNLLINGIIYEVWKRLEQKPFLEIFTHIVIERARRLQNLFSRDYSDVARNFDVEFRQNHNRRRILLDNLFSYLLKIDYENASDFYSRLTFTHIHPIQEDFEWILDRYQEISHDGNYKQIFASFVRSVFKADDSTHLDTLQEIMDNDEVLKGWFSQYYFVEFESEIVKISQEARKRDEEFTSSLIGDIEALLQRCENETPLLWHHIIVRYLNRGFIWDITQSKNWSLLSDEMKVKILQNGVHYLDSFELKDENWLGKNHPYSEHIAVYMMIRFMFINGIEIPTETWRKYCSIIIHYGVFASIDAPHSEKIFSKLYSQAPDDFLNYLSKYIDNTHSIVNLLNCIRDCWDERLIELIYQKWLQSDLPVRKFLDLSRALFSKNHPQVTQTVLSQFIQLAPFLDKFDVESDDYKLVQKLIADLVTYSSEGGWWLELWQVIKHNTEFCRAILIAVTDSPFNRFLSLILSQKESDIGDLVTWILYNFDSESHVRWDLESPLINLLASKGTDEALNQLEILSQHYPSHYQIHKAIRDIKGKRLAIWQIWNIKQLHRMIRDATVRLIESGEQLLDVIIQELQRIQSNLLGGENSLRSLLWNISTPQKKKTMAQEPKDEREFAIFIKKHLGNSLQEYNISLTLESERERGYGEGNRQGEYIDIRIEYQLEGHKPIIAYIEVKKDSHREVKTAIKTQLSERYLRDGGYGIYLVGWYGTQNDTIDSLTQYLETEARNLSTDGKLIKSFVMDISLK